MIGVIRRAMARFEDSIWGDALGAACLFVLLFVALMLPVPFVGGAP